MQKKKKKIKSKRNFFPQQHGPIIGKYVRFTQETVRKTNLFSLENEYLIVHMCSCEKLNFTRDFSVFIIS